MPSKEEIESSRIPISLFLLSTILLGATTRTTLEDKDDEEGELHGEEEALEDGRREDKDGDREAVEALEDGEAVEAVEAVEKGEHGEHGEAGELHGAEEGDGKKSVEPPFVKPPFVKAHSAPGLLPGSPAPAEAPAPELLAPAPAPPPRRVTRSAAAAAGLPPAAVPASAARLLPVAVPASAAGLLPAAAPAAAAGLLPASAARRFSPLEPLLTPIREESIKSTSEDSELEEVLGKLDEKFYDNVEILKILQAIDTIIDNEDFSSLDKINETLQRYGITITSENISINI